MRPRTPVRYAAATSPHRRRFVALCVAVFVCLGTALPAAADQTEDQLQQLRAQEANQRSQLDQLTSQQQAAQATLERLKAALDARAADLSGLTAQAAALTRQIHEFEVRETELQKRHDHRVQTFLGLTRDTYKRGTSNWMVYLFNSTSFSEFLDRLAYTMALARNDVDQAQMLRREREQIADQRRGTEALRAQLEPLLQELAAKLGDATSAYDAQAVATSSIEDQQLAQLRALQGTLRQEKQLEAALAAAQAAAQAAASKGAGRSYGAVCPAAPPGMVSFCGHGFGHGVGLGQYGALGMAQNNFSWQRILAAFYTGTTLGAFPAQTVRVYLTGAGSNLTPRFNGASVMDSGGATLAHVGADTTVQFSRNPDGSVGCSVCNGQSGKPLRLVPDTAGVFEVSGSKACYDASGRQLPCRYRGEAWLDASAPGVRVINHVDLEDYLLGLGEVPSSWPLNAVAAQVTAARTYALAHLGGGGAFDVDDTTSFQVYGGYDREAPQQTAAVNTTRGQAIFYRGQLIDAVFSSSDGGHTECASAEWGQGDNPCSPSYLQGVIDNYDVSPLHTWYTPAHKLSEIQGYLMAGKVYDATTCGVLDHFVFHRDASDRVRSVDMVGDKGTCSASSNTFITGLNNGSPTDFIIYGELFGTAPGSRAWPYF